MTHLGNMKKLSETWKQKKAPVTLTGGSKQLDSSSSVKDKIGLGVGISTTKRLGVGRVPAASSSRSAAPLRKETKTGLAVPSVASTSAAQEFSSSFFHDLDPAIIDAVDSLEAAAYEADSALQQALSKESKHGGSAEKTKTPNPRGSTAKTTQNPRVYTAKATTTTPNRKGNTSATSTTSAVGKRKNSRSVRSASRRPSLFGDVSENSPGKSFSPTQSPRDKKRKSARENDGRAEKGGWDGEGVEIETEISPVLLSASVQNGSCGRTSCVTSGTSSSSSVVAYVPAVASNQTVQCGREFLRTNEKTDLCISENTSCAATSASFRNSSGITSVAAIDLCISENTGCAATSASSRSSSDIASVAAIASKSATVRHGPEFGETNGKATLRSGTTIKSSEQSSEVNYTKLRQNRSTVNENPETCDKKKHKEDKSNEGNENKGLSSLHGNRDNSDVKSKTRQSSSLGSASTSSSSSSTTAKTIPAVNSTTAAAKTASKTSSASSSTTTAKTSSSSAKTTLASSSTTAKTSSTTAKTTSVNSTIENEQAQSSRSSSSSHREKLPALNARMSNLRTTGADTERKSETAMAPERQRTVGTTANGDGEETGITSHNVSGLQSGATIGSQDMESLLLSSWGLPGPVLEAYHSQNITAMFPWQAQCLTTGNVLNGGNVVYSAPTSAGKTMVAELLMLKRVLETRRKALFILPFVSVTREKMISLQRLYQDAGVRVGGFMGGQSPAGGFQSVDVAVCTIEKGNGLVNRLMEENRISELGVVVIDELHMVGDSNRGYLLELLLTKICYMARKSRETSDHPIQVIGMSATLPNLDLLAKWLDADLYHTDFRPVPLTEHIKVNTTIYDRFMGKVRDIEVKATFQGDEDHILPLCLETIMGGHSVLIFCPTKAWCEKMAEKIAREFYGLLKSPASLAAYTGNTGFVKASEMAHLPIDQASLQNVLEQLGRSPVGIDPLLGKVTQYGVAYHHAGLTFDERDIVEGAFRQGLLKVLVATSTLSSGVNLPARRVIVRSPMFGGRAMDALAYKQMAGRAGRKGVDTEGECVLVCKEGEKKIAQNLLKTELPPVTSCLCGQSDESAQLSRSMKRAILEVVVGGVASTPADVARYVACTLLSASLPAGDQSTSALIQACLAFLEENEFVRLNTVTDADNQEVQKYQPTQLGSAVLASSMSPDEGLAVFAELQKARQCFVLANELHIIYLVTPIYSQEISGHLDWYHFYCMWEKLSPDMRLVAKTVGVEEGFLAKAITGRVPTKTEAQARAAAIHRRFYTALALHELVQEVPLLEVAARYHCNKGQLQSLMQSAATFAGMVTVFCARLGWSNMELLFAQFQQRLTMGVTRELCDLVRIPLLTGSMARVLFNAGYQTVASVAHADPQEVETVFRKASPFQSTKKQEGETEWDLERRRKARCMWLAGRKDVTELEAAVAVIDEAKTIIQQELGVRIDWKHEVKKSAVSLDESLHGNGEMSEVGVKIDGRHDAKTSVTVSSDESLLENLDMSVSRTMLSIENAERTPRQNCRHNAKISITASTSDASLQENGEMSVSRTMLSVEDSEQTSRNDGPKQSLRHDSKNEEMSISRTMLSAENAEGVSRNDGSTSRQSFRPDGDNLPSCAPVSESHITGRNRSEKGVEVPARTVADTDEPDSVPNVLTSPGIVCSSHTVNNSRKRKSTEGAETPSTVHHPKRSLACRSVLKRGKGIRSPPVMEGWRESPFLGGGGRRNSRSPQQNGSPHYHHNNSRSPKDLSFFGQVVVSPPAAMVRRTTQKMNGGFCAAKEDTSSSSVIEKQGEKGNTDGGFSAIIKRSMPKADGGFCTSKDPMPLVLEKQGKQNKTDGGFCTAKDPNHSTLQKQGQENSTDNVPAGNSRNNELGKIATTAEKQVKENKTEDIPAGIARNNEDRNANTAEKKISQKEMTAYNMSITKATEKGRNGEMAVQNLSITKAAEKGRNKEKAGGHSETASKKEGMMGRSLSVSTPKARHPDNRSVRLFGTRSLSAGVCCETKIPENGIISERSVANGATSVGKDETSVGNHATSVGNYATSVGNDGSSIGNDAKSVGRDARSVGDHASKANFTGLRSKNAEHGLEEAEQKSNGYEHRGRTDEENLNSGSVSASAEMDEKCAGNRENLKRKGFVSHVEVDDERRERTVEENLNGASVSASAEMDEKSSGKGSVGENRASVTVSAEMDEKSSGKSSVEENFKKKGFFYPVVEVDSDDCFNDSLIINTQTDNMITGRLSDSNSISDKSFEAATASTPLVSAHSVSKTKAQRIEQENSKKSVWPSVQLYETRKQLSEECSTNTEAHSTEHKTSVRSFRPSVQLHDTRKQSSDKHPAYTEVQAIVTDAKENGFSKKETVISKQVRDAEIRGKKLTSRLEYQTGCVHEKEASAPTHVETRTAAYPKTQSVSPVFDGELFTEDLFSSPMGPVPVNTIMGGLAGKENCNTQTEKSKANEICASLSSERKKEEKTKTSSHMNNEICASLSSERKKEEKTKTSSHMNRRSQKLGRDSSMDISVGRFPFADKSTENVASPDDGADDSYSASDNSAELIAASNFERLAYAEEGMINSSGDLDTSFENGNVLELDASFGNVGMLDASGVIDNSGLDCGVRMQDRLLVCEDRDPEERVGEDVELANVCVSSKLPTRLGNPNIKVTKNQNFGVVSNNKNLKGTNNNQNFGAASSNQNFKASSKNQNFGAATSDQKFKVTNSNQNLEVASSNNLNDSFNSTFFGASLRLSQLCEPETGEPETGAAALKNDVITAATASSVVFTVALTTSATSVSQISTSTTATANSSLTNANPSLDLDDFSSSLTASMMERASVSIFTTTTTANSIITNANPSVDVDEFSSSLTASMMERAFADDSFGSSMTLDQRHSSEGQSSKIGGQSSKRNSSESWSSKRNSEGQSSNEGQRSKRSSREGQSSKRKSNEGQSSKGTSSEATTPQNNSDCVPPTPPDESCASLLRSPAVRRTPMRACRAKAQQSNQTPQASDTPKTRSRGKEKREKSQSSNSKTSAGVKSDSGSTISAVAKVGSSVDGQQHSLPHRHKNNRNIQGVENETSDGETASVEHPKSRKSESETLFADQQNIDHPKSGNSKSETLFNDHQSINQHAKSRKPESQTLYTDQQNVDQHPESQNLESQTLFTDEQILAPPIEMDSPPLTQDCLCVVDVCASAELFSTFVEEWRSQSVYGISVACEKRAAPVGIGGGIGGNFIQGRATRTHVPSTEQGIVIAGDEERVIVGLAVSWASHDAYYISFLPDHADVSLDDTMAAPPCTQSLSLDEITTTIKTMLHLSLNKTPKRTVVAYDAKAVYTALARGLGAVFGRCRDPVVANWLLDPSAREKTLHSMVTNYLPEDLPLLEGIGGSMGYGSLGLSVRGSGSARLRAVTESIVSRRLMDSFWVHLTKAELEMAFTNTEMPSVLTLARMELNGFGFSSAECESQRNLMMAKLSSLEQEAYSLAGHPFSLTSTDDISQILYLELQLPVNGDPTSSKPTRTLGPSRRAPRGRQKSAFSTSKDILEKLKSYHPLPAIILEWRRISSALTKHVYPLQKEKVQDARLKMDRIYSEWQTHTATGRVSMTEPNLQNIPKDFDIILPDVIGESPTSQHTTSHIAASTVRGKGSHSRLQTMRGAMPQAARLTDPAHATHTAVSMRHAFIPFPGGVMVAADYSQLELRVIAHLSRDPKLISILNNDGDVFKMIAAQWKNTLPELVSAQDRQHAKQICYGMLYGIGPKALGEQIGVDENDAAVFMESFKAKYTGMRAYLRKTVEQCREHGFVTTVTGRRRYLPAIRDANPHARAQAERQAVNTTVQGSAADIAKAAMNRIDQQLATLFPDTRLPHRHRLAASPHPRGAFLVLQLHDELVYEVSAHDLTKVVKVIKHHMENTTPLHVRLPVKVRVGPSWGRLEEIDM